VPDRLASHIVMQVMETMAEYGLLRCAAVGDDAAITNLNNATDTAIEEVEKLLRQD
jgi:hypothetical protein